MADPCQFQGVIMKTVEDGARHEQAIKAQGREMSDMASDMKKIAENVELIASKITSMRGFVAGAAAAGGALVGLIVWVIKSLPAAAAMVIK